MIPINDLEVGKSYTMTSTLLGESTSKPVAVARHSENWIILQPINNPEEPILTRSQSTQSQIGTQAIAPDMLRVGT